MADWSDHEWKLLIGGELVDGANGTSPIVNPATEEVVGSRARGVGRPGARRRARPRRKRSPQWSATPVAERAALLPRGHRPAHEGQADLVPLIISETGATAHGRLAHAGAGARSSASSATPVTRARTSGSRSRRRSVAATPLAPGALMGAYVNRQPVGAVACISPYNFPLTNIAGQDRARARGRAAPS